MKRTIQSWARIGWGACLAAVLAACGGGGSSGGADEASVSVRVEGLSAGSLTLVDDRGHTAVLSANGLQTFARMAAGTTFTPSISSQPSNQVCALDAGARTAASGLELLVRCEAGLLSTSGLRSFAVDQLVMMDTLEAGSAGSVTLGGVAVTPLNNTTGGFTFRVPELTVGAHELRAMVNGRAFSTVLDITANPMTGDPGEFLRQAAANAQSRITALLNDPAVTEADKTIVRQLQTDLSAMNVDAVVDAATGEQLRSLARFVAANDPVALQVALDALLPPLDEQASAQSATLRRVSAAAVVDQRKCIRSSIGFVGSIASMGIMIGAYAVTSSQPVGVVLSGFFTLGLVEAGLRVGKNLAQMQTVCGGYVGMLVGSRAVEASDSTASAARAQSLASGPVAAQSVARLRAQAATGLAFNGGEPAVLDVVLQKSLSAEVSDRVLAAVARVVSAHRALAGQLSGVLTLPGADLIDALAKLQRNFTEPARALQLEALTSGFSGTIEPVLDGQGQLTGRFTVVFTSTVAPSSDAPIPFSFRLHDTTADYLGPVINATLQMPLTPVARDLAFETNLDTTLNARLTATHATGFALVELPASGSLTLTNAATGAFTYTPSTGFSGTVGFTYLASNDRATSQTATVVVAVLGAQVQCELSESSDSFTLSYRRECKHYLASGAVTDEGFWSAALPDAIQRYWRIGGDQDYISLSENFSRSPGLSALVGVASVGHDAALEQFTLNRSSGHYDPDTGALAQPSPTFTGQDNDLRLQSQRERVTFRKHPVSGLFIVHSMQRALLQRSYLVNGTVVVDRLERAAATLQALDAQGAPTYVTETIRCWRPSTLDSGGYALTSGAEWTVEQVTTTNRTETSRTFTADGVCPLSATTLLNGVGPEKGLNDLSFDWRNPPLPSGG